MCRLSTNTEGESFSLPMSLSLSNLLRFYFVFCRFASTVAFHPDGNCIGVGTSDNVVKVHVHGCTLSLQ